MQNTRPLRSYNVKKVRLDRRPGKGHKTNSIYICTGVRDLVAEGAGLHAPNKQRLLFHSLMGVYLHGVSNRIKRADSTHCCFHLVRFPNARRFNLSGDTVDCQINVPISIYCFGLNSKIWKLVNTRGVVKQSGRDGSVLNRSPQWSFYANPHPVSSAIV